MKKSFVLKPIMLSLCLSLPLIVSGCNTVAGAGKDIQKGGEGIQKIATTKKEDKSQQSTSDRKQHRRSHQRMQNRSDMSQTNDSGQMTENS